MAERPCAGVVKNVAAAAVAAGNHYWAVHTAACGGAWCGIAKADAVAAAAAETCGPGNWYGLMEGARFEKAATPS